MVPRNPVGSSVEAETHLREMVNRHKTKGSKKTSTTILVRSKILLLIMTQTMSHHQSLLPTVQDRVDKLRHNLRQLNFNHHMERQYSFFF